YLGGSDGTVHAFDAETGNSHWWIQFPGALLSSFAVARGRLYAATNRAVYTVDASRVEDSNDRGGGSGRSPVQRDRTWGSRLDTSIRGSPTVRDERVILGTDDGVVALTAADGSVEWTTARTETVRGSPAVTDDRVFAGTTDGEVVAYSVEGGFEQWRQSVGGRIDTAPVVADGTLYVAATDGTVAALSPSDGSVQWEIQRDHTAPTAPHALDGRLYLADWDGTLSALLSPN
ncbi:MAG: PQQ-binding-like beta-propeller repeat protein, partial [Halobaculum sp.]